MPRPPVPNVDFYSGAVYYMIEVPPSFYTAIFATLISPLNDAPKLLMMVVQLNIGLYIGTKLDKDRLLLLRSTVPK